LTRDGELNADALRKLKQVNHLVRLLEPALDEVWQRQTSPVVVDAGSGSAYLGFILYELFLKRSEKGQLWSVDSRPELSERARQRAGKLGFDRMVFETAELSRAKLPDRVHLLTALHACDTATDDAIIAAIQHHADHVALVPCCQAEVAEQLKQRSTAPWSPMDVLFERPWHRREFASHLTNVIRALVLESFGFQVTVTELTGWEHSLKNELILGRKVHRENRGARQRLHTLLDATGVAPKVIRELGLSSSQQQAQP
jgi:hypothetical protein